MRERLHKKLDEIVESVAALQFHGEMPRIHLVEQEMVAVAQLANRRLVVIQAGRHLGGLFYERNDVPVFHRLHIDSRKAVEQFVDIPAAFLVPDDEFAVFLADVEFVEALIILGLSLIGMVVEIKETARVESA